MTTTATNLLRVEDLRIVNGQHLRGKSSMVDLLPDGTYKAAKVQKPTPPKRIVKPQPAPKVWTFTHTEARVAADERERQLLADFAEASNGEPREAFTVNPDTGRARHYKSLVDARSRVIRILRGQGHTLAEIGRMVSLDHTTVMNALRLTKPSKAARVRPETTAADLALAQQLAQDAIAAGHFCKARTNLTRKPASVAARFALWKVLRGMHFSYPEIARLCGLTGHSMIIEAVRGGRKASP